ncbi:MAG TPA: FAD-binding oxidoreductase [Trichocoleus sp.]|jgi:glycine/D-amino acid oxidase-like deaminating enzyme
MTTYDWIVVGGGLAGSALSYELAAAGFKVLLLEQSIAPQSATRYSYGGIAYWSGTTPLMRQLCQEGIEIHRNLSAELEGDTQFREIDLLLTIDPDRDPEAIAANYAHFAISPKLICPKTACEIEPLLDPEAIAAAFHVQHGHVSPEAVVQTYQQAFLRYGGEIQIESVIGLIQTDRSIQGVVTSTGSYASAHVAVCAGGMSRSLLKQAGLSIRLCYTQAELIETPPVELKLRSIVMPATLKRFELEAEAGQPEVDRLWDEPGYEVAPAILDEGAIQLLDGRIRMGQVSRTFTDPTAVGDSAQSEQEIRSAVGRVLPGLKNLPGQWHTCLVSFSGDRLPFVGAIPETKGVYLFAGFGNPFAILPPLARRFARHAAGQPDDLLPQVSPDRFSAPAAS